MRNRRTGRIRRIRRIRRSTSGRSGRSGGQAPSGQLSAGDSVEFVATEFAFAPSEVMAEPGAYTGTLVNDGTIEHDITFENGATVVAAVGETVEFEFEVPEEGVRYWCSIPGHQDAGMAGVINTSASASAAADAAAAPMEGHGAVGDAATTVEADPDAPPYEYRDPRAPAHGEGEGFTLTPGGAPDGGDLIDVELVVEEKQATVAEGFVQQIWTFNGTMPGPVIRTQVGDTVRESHRQSGGGDGVALRRLPRFAGRMERRDEVDRSR